MQQYVLQYVQVALGREWPSSFLFFRGTKFTYAQYTNIFLPHPHHAEEI